MNRPSNPQPLRVRSFAVACVPLCFSVLLVFAGSTRAQSKLTLRTNYYAVTGGTLKDIHRSLSHSRPWQGSRRDGQTDWKVNWKTRLSPTGNGCRIASFHTETVITITLPMLRIPPNTPPEVTKAWHTYLTALMKHEQGHVKLARAAADQIQRAVGGLGSSGDCGELNRQIKETAGRALEASKEQHRKYDQRTRHGATEGAVLPRSLEGERRRRE